MAGAGIAGGWYMLPEIQSLSSASTPDQVQFFLSKTTALATAISLFGQTVSGLIGILFSDKQ